jgi:hypothetical protein
MATAGIGSLQNFKGKATKQTPEMTWMKEMRGITFEQEHQQICCPSL